jgi:hypothetical protein
VQTYIDFIIFIAVHRNVEQITNILGTSNKLCLKKQVAREWTGFIWLRIRTNGGL